MEIMFATSNFDNIIKLFISYYIYRNIMLYYVDCFTAGNDSLRPAKILKENLLFYKNKTYYYQTFSL